MLLVALDPAIVDPVIVIVIVICIAIAMVGGPLGLLILRSHRAHRLGRGEVHDAIDAAAGWRHMQGG